MMMPLQISDSEYLKGKVTGFVGRWEYNVLFVYTTYVNI